MVSYLAEISGMVQNSKHLAIFFMFFCSELSKPPQKSILGTVIHKTYGY
jgi:hypothetical protein